MVSTTEEEQLKPLMGFLVFLGRRVTEELWPSWATTTSAGTRLTSTTPTGFGAPPARTSSRARSTTATCRSAILLSPQGMFLAQTGMTGEHTGNGNIRYLTTATVSLKHIDYDYNILNQHLVHY